MGKKKTPANIGLKMVLLSVLGFAIGILICWFTFSYLGGNNLF